VPEPKIPSTPVASCAPRSLPIILKADEVAELLRVNRKTLYEAVQRDEVPGVIRIGRSLRFRRDAVLMWLSNSCAVPNHEEQG
jgi:excisionase family DNA binding protein